MKIIDVPEPSKIDRKPDQTISLIEEGDYIHDDFTIQTVEMRSYNQKNEQKLSDKSHGSYTIITAFVQTDKGSIEILYDQGHYENTVLEDAVKFLTEHLGLSGLILRCIISLKNKL